MASWFNEVNQTMKWRGRWPSFDAARKAKLAGFGATPWSRNGDFYKEWSGRQQDEPTRREVEEFLAKIDDDYAMIFKFQ